MVIAWINQWTLFYENANEFVWPERRKSLSFWISWYLHSKTAPSHRIHCLLLVNETKSTTSTRQNALTSSVCQYDMSMWKRETTHMLATKKSDVITITKPGTSHLKLCVCVPWMFSPYASLAQWFFLLICQNFSAGASTSRLWQTGRQVNMEASQRLLMIFVFGDLKWWESDIHHELSIFLEYRDMINEHGFLAMSAGNWSIWWEHFQKKCLRP